MCTHGHTSLDVTKDGLDLPNTTEINTLLKYPYLLQMRSFCKEVIFM